MSIISLLLLLIVLGFVVYLVNAYVPMQPIFKTIFNFIIILILIVAVLNVFGFTTGLNLRL